MASIHRITIMCAALTCMLPGYFAGQPADMILFADRIYTLNPSAPPAEAVAVSGERISFVGDRKEAEAYRGSDTRVLDLTGKTVLPGLIDAHGHLLSLGRSLSQLGLTGTKSAKQIQALVREKQLSVQAGQWIEGRGWDQNDWREKEFPTWRDLAGTEANPVYLRRVDGHAAWLNRTALELCGIHRETPDPSGGRILRDQDGNPTGVLIDNALDLARAVIPAPTHTDLLDWARAAIKECHRVGLVGMHDAGIDSAALEVYRELEKRGELTLRIYGMLSDEDPAFLDRWLEQGPDTTGGYLTIRSIKAYADGALGSRGAALLEPYSDEPGSRGLTIHAPGYYYRLTSRALKRGFQVCTHAIGDAANRMILDEYEKALKEYPSGDHRLRIEHCQILTPSDIPRFAQLGVIASMQPTHATSDMPWAHDRVGGERIKGAYIWRSILEAGGRLALGSDFPVESPNPLWGIYAGITRQDQSGIPPGGWFSEQRLTREEAVRGFTLDAAYAQFEEDLRGSIEVGKLADFTVLDRNIFEISPAEILKTKAIYTIVGGKVVYAHTLSH
jgi:predicted amidohydrolase YtcJ